MSRRQLRSAVAGLQLAPVVQLPGSLSGELPPYQKRTAKRVKREHEDGLFSEVRKKRSAEPVVIDELRKAVESLLHPVKLDLGVLRPALVYSACCDDEAAQEIIVAALRSAAAAGDWHELWVLLGQVGAWLTFLPHMNQGTLRPWWVREARSKAGRSGVAEVVHLDAEVRQIVVKLEPAAASSSAAASSEGPSSAASLELSSSMAAPFADHPPQTEWPSDGQVNRLYQEDHEGLDNEGLKPPDTIGWSCLHTACAVGDFTTVVQLLKNGYDANAAVGYNRGTPIRYPLDLAAGSPPNGWTPLHEAATLGHDGIVAELLRAGANYKSKTDAQETVDSSMCFHGSTTPLEVAVDQGNSGCVAQMLVSNKRRSTVVEKMQGAVWVERDLSDDPDYADVIRLANTCIDSGHALRSRIRWAGQAKRILGDAFTGWAPVGDCSDPDDDDDWDQDDDDDDHPYRTKQTATRR